MGQQLTPAPGLAEGDQQAAEFRAAFGVRLAVQARLKVTPRLGPVGIHQRQTACGEQQLAVIRPILQPLFGRGQLMVGRRRLELAIKIDQVIAPIAAQCLAKQAFRPRGIAGRLPAQGGGQR